MTEGVDEGRIDDAPPTPMLPVEPGDGETEGKEDSEANPVGCVDKLGPCEG